MMLLILIHASATLFMTGLIWFVQVVHYPLMVNVGAVGFKDYETHHQRLTTWVVGPAMLVELTCAAWLVIQPIEGIPIWMVFTGLALLILIWLSTGFLQVPRHRELERGFDATAHRRLVRSNWIRTVGWTLRSAGAVCMIGFATI